MRILILALLLALGFGSIVTFQYLSAQDVANKVRTNMADTTRMLQRYVSDGQQEQLRGVTLVAMQPVMKSALLVPDVKSQVETGKYSPDLASNLEVFCQSVSVDSLAIMNDEGHIVASSQRWPTHIQDLFARPGMKDVFEGADWNTITAENGHLYQIVATAIPISEEGWFGALIGIDEITNDEARDLRFNQDSEVVFLSGTDILASSNSFPAKFETVPNKIQDAVAGGHDFKGIYGQLPDTKPEQKLGFVALQNHGSIAAFNRSAGTSFLGVLVLMMIVGLVLGERFTRSLVKPLDEVVKAATEMRSGQTPKPFDIGKRRDEVGVLQSVFNDMVTAVEENQKLLLGMIDTDPLTGLGNHRSFQEKVRAATAWAKKSQQPLSVLLMDLDHFHEYNQLQGHGAGDGQLKSYASVLRAASPGTAVLARYSGDQFVILLPNHTNEEAVQVAEAAREAIKKEANLISNSIGVATLDPDAQNEDALVLSAELALSSAKQLGGDRISLFTSELEFETPGGTQLMQQYLTDGSLATVQALAAAVDAKDQYTNGHSGRVADLARELAEHMGCTPQFVELVYRAGTLHDVGKIGVPDAILGKPDRLTAEEMAIMETHPVLGEVIVAKVPQLSVLLPGVRHHHERWDGKGYPDGLAGEQIPVMARYLAVADTFDAMTSDRPYRTALSVEVALHEIEKCAGTQFQSELAMAFVQMVRRKMPAPPELSASSA